MPDLHPMRIPEFVEPSSSSRTRRWGWRRISGASRPDDDRLAVGAPTEARAVSNTR